MVILSGYTVILCNTKKLFISVNLSYVLQTALPVNSPMAGVITELLVADGDTVEKGQELFKIDVSGKCVNKTFLCGNPS